MKLRIEQDDLAEMVVIGVKRLLRIDIKPEDVKWFVEEDDSCHVEIPFTKPKPPPKQVRKKEPSGRGPGRPPKNPPEPGPSV